MIKNGALIKWHESTEHLELDPNKLPQPGQFINTWERLTSGAPKLIYRALVKSASTEKGGKNVVTLQYLRKHQPQATKDVAEVWGTSTLEWTSGNARGIAKWIDDDDSSRNGTCPLSINDGTTGANAGKGREKFWCEIWTGTGWETWPVAAAYPFRSTAPVRCYECHGPITLMQDGKTRAHFEHKPAHRGCSLVYGPRWQQLPESGPKVAADATDSDSPDYFSEAAVSELIGPVGETEKERLILARVGQGAFRVSLVKAWGRCSVTNCGPHGILIASHIVAWRHCESNEERLDVNNGLLLTPNLDKLFDRHLISFLDDGQLVLSKKLATADAQALGISASMRLRKVPTAVIPYLQRHRKHGEWVALTASS